MVLNSTNSQPIPDIDFLQTAIQMAIENDTTYESSDNSLKQQENFDSR